MADKFLRIIGSGINKGKMYLILDTFMYNGMTFHVLGSNKDGYISAGSTSQFLVFKKKHHTFDPQIRPYIRQDMPHFEYYAVKREGFRDHLYEVVDMPMNNQEGLSLLLKEEI